MAGGRHSVWDDIKQAGNDLVSDPLKVPGDLAQAVHDALHAGGYPPGISAKTFGAMAAAGAGTSGLDVGQLAGAAFSANFIENTLFTSPEQQGNINNANAAV